MATYLLCGFMGSGKTTVSERLSGEVIAIDLDTLILEKLQIKGFESIAHYVEEEGWEEFRFLEADNLSFLLDSCSAEEKDVVVALGGGAVNELTLPIIEDSKARLVWLNVPFETCWERIKNSSDRPLVYEGKTGVPRYF